MPRGRPPRSEEVKEASGYYRKNPDRRPTTVIKGDSRVPVAPETVSQCPYAITVWHELIEILQETGVLSRTDVHLLENYTITVAEWRKCVEKCQQHGHVDADGKRSEWSKTMNALSQQMAKLLPELGMTPSGRSRLSTVMSTAAPKEEKSGLAAFLEEAKGE